MNLDNINSQAIFLIYPDGTIETIERDSRNFHMEYMVELLEKSEKLHELVKESNIHIPTDENEIKYLVTLELDTLLAQYGIISFHNILIDSVFENQEYADTMFSVIMPSSLTDKQKEVLANIFKKYNMTESWFGVYQDNQIIDMEYNEVKERLDSKTK